MREDKNAPIKWATMVPLIGGSAFGCYNATGTKPQYNMSYTPFAANESFFYRYWDDVPVYRSKYSSSDGRRARVSISGYQKYWSDYRFPSVHYNRALSGLQSLELSCIERCGTVSRRRCVLAAPRYAEYERPL